MAADANNFPETIKSYILDHHVMVLATQAGDQPYVASLYYYFHDPSLSFIFISERKTRHVQELAANPRIAGAVHNETRQISLIQGLQFTGSVSEILEVDKATEQASLPEEIKNYYKKFPEAAGRPGVFFRVEMDYCKFTNNKIKFGDKTIWNRKS